MGRKRGKLDRGMFDRTAPAGAEAAPLPDNAAAVVTAILQTDMPAEGLTTRTGVGLKQSEMDLIDAYAARYGVARNALMRFATRFFLQALESGALELDQYIEAPPPPPKRLNMP